MATKSGDSGSRAKKTKKDAPAVSVTVDSNAAPAKKRAPRSKAAGASQPPAPAEEPAPAMPPPPVAPVAVAPPPPAPKVEVAPPPAPKPVSVPPPVEPAKPAAKAASVPPAAAGPIPSRPPPAPVRPEPEPCVEATLVFEHGMAEMEAFRERDRVVLRPGTKVRVHYLREPQDIAQDGLVVRVELGYRFDNDESRTALVADGQRSAAGLLVRRAPVLDVPDRPGREVQMWFRMDLEDGRVLWDSLWGHNYRFPVSY